MPRRVSLPGADELFRATTVRSITPAAVAEEAEAGPEAPSPALQRVEAPTRPANRRPSGREKHDEKITVYVSPSELVDLEHVRLRLRADHGVAVDRGRIVREAIAVVLADFEAKGLDSILVRRLQDR